MAPANIKDFFYCQRMIDAGSTLYDRGTSQRASFTQAAEIYCAMRAHDQDPDAADAPTTAMIESGLVVLLLPRPANHLKPQRLLEMYHTMRLLEPEPRERASPVTPNEAANWLRRQANAEKDPKAKAAFVEAHNAILSMAEGA